MGTSKETVQKYLDALRELHTVLKYQPELSMAAFMDEKGLRKDTAKLLKEGGIIENIGTRGRGMRYVWKSIPPNVKMVEELFRRRAEEKKRTAHKKTRVKTKELTPSMVKDIKVLRDKGMKYKEISNIIGCKEYQINFALNYDVAKPKNKTPIKEISIFWGLFKLTIKNK